MANQGGQRVHAVFQVKALDRTRIIVLDTQDLSLGRAAENDLSIDEPEMSRKHAVFRRSAEGCRVDDLGTSNGTHVNGESVEHAVLTHGDVIRIGEVEITFAETTRSPTALGPSVEYASQLKSFPSPTEGTAADGEATILGLMDTVTDPVHDFEVQRTGHFELDGSGDRPPESRARNIDEEVADLGPDPLEDLEFDGEPAATGGPGVASDPDPDPVWEFDDDEIASSAAESVPRPDPAPAAANPSPPRFRGRRLSLTLEIEGAEGELLRVLEGLAGKQLEIPRLRVRVKSRDLG